MVGPLLVTLKGSPAMSSERGRGIEQAYAERIHACLDLVTLVAKSSISGCDRLAPTCQSKFESPCIRPSHLNPIDNSISPLVDSIGHHHGLPALICLGVAAPIRVYQPCT